MYGPIVSCRRNLTAPKRLSRRRDHIRRSASVGSRRIARARSRSRFSVMLPNFPAWSRHPHPVGFADSTSPIKGEVIASPRKPGVGPVARGPAGGVVVVADALVRDREELALRHHPDRQLLVDGLDPFGVERPALDRIELGRALVDEGV